jgi:hypothetical protein
MELCARFGKVRFLLLEHAFVGFLRALQRATCPIHVWNMSSFLYNCTSRRRKMREEVVGRGYTLRIGAAACACLLTMAAPPSSASLSALPLQFKTATQLQHFTLRVSHSTLRSTGSPIFLGYFPSLNILRDSCSDLLCRRKNKDR